MFIEILKNTPIWVWPLLVVLVALGLRASRTRWMPAVMIYFMPLLGLLSVNNMLALPNQIVVWSVFFSRLCAWRTFGCAFAKRMDLGREDNRVHVAGEWVTMLTIVTVFVASFLNGMFVAIMPELIGLPIVYLGLTVIKASVAGVFIGRAAYVWRYMQRQTVPGLKT